LTKDTKNQVYDNILKRLFDKHATAIIPRLLAEDDIQVLEEIRLVESEEEAVEELNVEVLIPPRRNDRVFRI
jgi:hypothetical protein